MERSNVVIDSLPYVEEVHQDYEDYALALIEDEMKQIKPRPLPKAPIMRFRSELMKTEYTERLVDGEFKPREDNISFHPRKISRPSTLDEWRSVALPQAKSRFEAERIRGLILDAEKDETVGNWKAYNSKVLEPMKAQWTNTLAGKKESVEEVNFQRQQSQHNQYGPELDQLTTDYQQILYRRNQLQHAIEGMEREARMTRKRKEASVS